MDEERKVTTQQEDTRDSIGLLGEKERDKRATKPCHTLVHVIPV